MWDAAQKISFKVKNKAAPMFSVFLSVKASFQAFFGKCSHSEGTPRGGVSPPLRMREPPKWAWEEEQCLGRDHTGVRFISLTCMIKVYTLFCLCDIFHNRGQK